MEEYKVGLIKGRHDMPVSEFILDEVKDVFDFKSIADKIDNWIKFHISFSTYFGGPANQVDYTDIQLLQSNQRLVVYVTGLTCVTAELIRICLYRGVHLTLMHYDRESGEYKPQVIS